MKNTFLVAIIFLSGSIFSTENCLEIKDENAQLECITQEALAPKDSSRKKRIESDPDIAKLIKQRELEKKQREREELRKAKELEQIASERRKAQEKYDKIYNACILDKSDGVDMKAPDLRNALVKTCRDTANNPSYLESWKYN